jgi:hypothetical protein
MMEVKINYSEYTLIPEHLMLSISLYVNEGRLFGGFLQAVFSNDLFAATAKADDYNIQILPVYVKYIWNELPQACHGSKENIDRWLEKKRKEKENDLEEINNKH